MRKEDIERRPPPETFLELIKTEGRGNLKMFLGFAPGVGKTYRMLQEAHELKRKGVDVVIGVIDTHGRKDTELLLQGLEQIPLREVEYKGVKLQDIDMDALLVRFPELALIDELAHTNAPGGHNKKRWQDVEELLAMGVNCMTTMNVQHIESLNDDITRATGVQVKETVPDRFIVELADEVVDVDLPVDELLERLKDGKVYPKERTGTALMNFFQSHKLTALREYSLREVAKNVGAKAAKKDSTRAEENRKGAPRARILVAVSPNSQNARLLMRKGARLAGELNIDWDVICVKSKKQDEKKRTIGETQLFYDNMDFARSLGANVVILKGEDVADVILKYARKNRIGKIVIGRTAHPWYKRYLKDSIMEQLLSESGPIDVYVINFDNEE